MLFPSVLLLETNKGTLRKSQRMISVLEKYLIFNQPTASFQTMSRNIRHVIARLQKVLPHYVMSTRCTPVDPSAPCRGTPLSFCFWARGRVLKGVSLSGGVQGVQVTGVRLQTSEDLLPSLPSERECGSAVQLDTTFS